MKPFAFFLFSFAAAAQASASDYIYFPELARRAEMGQVKAMRQVLVIAEKTQPGERLEELAEISSKFVKRNPTGFLRAQKQNPSCFGVAFMGADYVDNPSARQREIQLRTSALQSVADASLASTKQRCLNLLGHK
jgi:hypothetical protein